MPVHDWTLVEAGIFHAHHTAWTAEIQNRLNGGLLPKGYYALAEQHAGPVEPAAHARRRSLAIRHVSGHRLIALLEIVSPANKDRPRHLEDFAAKVASALERGIHVLMVDLFPPGPHDPGGMHDVITQRLEQSDDPYDLPAEAPLTLASYAAGPKVDIYLTHLAVGGDLPEMPLFLRPDRYVYVPLGPTYDSAYQGMPAFWRDVLEGRPPQAL